MDNQVRPLMMDDDKPFKITIRYKDGNTTFNEFATRWEAHDFALRMDKDPNVASIVLGDPSGKGRVYKSEH